MEQANKKLILCSYQLPRESGEYDIKNNSGCNNGEGRMYFDPKTGWDIPDMIKSFYKVIGWYEKETIFS
jgi:hypothetical protein